MIRWDDASLRFRAYAGFINMTAMNVQLKRSLTGIHAHGRGRASA